MPNPSYSQIFEAQAERDDMADQLAEITKDMDILKDEAKDAAMKADDDCVRIRELENALADVLSIIAGDVLPSDLAETDKEFRRLYKVL